MDEKQLSKIKKLAPAGKPFFSEEQKGIMKRSGMTVLLMIVTKILTFHLSLPNKIARQLSIDPDSHVIVNFPLDLVVTNWLSVGVNFTMI